jgi:hypothetical protein
MNGLEKVMAISIFGICIIIAIISFAPSHKAQEISACMSQPGMQYVRELGSHYVCIPAPKE